MPLLLRQRRECSEGLLQACNAGGIKPAHPPPGLAMQEWAPFSRTGRS